MMAASGDPLLPTTLAGGGSAGVSSKTSDIMQLPGFGSVPPKLTKRIVAREFVDMWELLPETWQLETEGSCCQTRRPRRSLVTDINIWTECYATMAAILASAFPEKAPHLFAYLRTITKASRTFESSAWASYDMAYRRQAANRGSLDWGVVDTALYNEAFAGRAKIMSRCRYCLADTHGSRECVHAPVEGGAATGAGPSYSGSTDNRIGRLPSRQTVPAGRGASADICRLFNSLGGSRCKFPQCRYAHLCLRCRRPHPQSECGEKRQRGRSRSPRRPHSPPTAS